MDVLGILLIIAFAGAIAWNSVAKARVLFLLSRRAVQTGTVRGFWGDFFAYCHEGKYTFLLAFIVAIPLFLILLIAAPLTAARR